MLFQTGSKVNAEKGDPLAQAMYGMMLENGWGGTTKDEA